MNKNERKAVEFETLCKFVSLEITCIAVNQKTGEMKIWYGDTDWQATAKDLAAELTQERTE